MLIDKIGIAFLAAKTCTFRIINFPVETDTHTNTPYASTHISACYGNARDSVHYPHEYGKMFSTRLSLQLSQNYVCDIKKINSLAIGAHV